MKLFLYSFAFNLSELQFQALENLTGKNKEDIRIAIIDNASDVIPDSDSWVKETHNIFIERGYNLNYINLNSEISEKELKESLENKDIIWVNAGNTFYLRYILQKSGADKIIKQEIAKGVVYAGWSAGAIVAGNTLKHINLMEEEIPNIPIILEGLNLTDITIVPHMDNPEFSENAAKLLDALNLDNIKTQPLNDNQVFIINGKEKIIL